jgi:uncharacterized membrane protein
MFQITPTTSLLVSACGILFFILITKFNAWVRAEISDNDKESSIKELAPEVPEVTTPAQYEEIPNGHEVILHAVKGKLPEDFVRHRISQNQKRRRQEEFLARSMGERRFPSPRGW